MTRMSYEGPFAKLTIMEIVRNIILHYRLSLYIIIVYNYRLLFCNIMFSNINDTAVDKTMKANRERE